MNHDDLMRYLDGELAPSERTAFERSIEKSTEVQREVAIFDAIKNDLQNLSFTPGQRRSVWYAVHRRLGRPVGWVLLVTGAVLWAIYGAYLYLMSAIEPIEKLATGGIFIGVLLLLASVLYERYRVWLTDPYRDVQR